MSIQFKGSSIAGVIPDVGEIQTRELAINIADKKLFTKDDGGAIVEICSDNINTGLEKLTVSGKTGYRIIGVNTTNPIGVNAIDLTTTAGVTFGAQGDNSIAIGSSAIASNSNGISIGNSNNLVTSNSLTIGFGNTVNGLTSGVNNIIIGNTNSSVYSDSIIYGVGNSTSADDTIVIGVDNSTSTSSQLSVLLGTGLTTTASKVIIGTYNEDITGSVFEIANGINSTAKRTIFAIDGNGVATLPKATINGNITSAGNQAVITLGYLGDASTGGVVSVNGESGAVTIDTDNLPIGATNTNYFFTDTDSQAITDNSTAITQINLNKEPSITIGTAKQVWAINSGGTDKVWIDNTFVGADDTPLNYSSAIAGMVVSVNSTADGVEFTPFDSSSVGLGEVENMSPDNMVNTNFLPDGITPNPIHNEFVGLRKNKTPSPGEVTASEQDYVLVANTIGVDGEIYTTRWTSRSFENLTDVDIVVGDANKFVRVTPDPGNDQYTLVFTDLSIDMMDDVDTTTVAPTTNQILKWDDTNWVPADDIDTNTTYTAGTGLALASEEFTLNSDIDGLTDVDTTTVAPTTNQILKWDDTNWVPADDIDTTYTVQDGELSENNLTDALKTTYDAKAEVLTYVTTTTAVTTANGEYIFADSTSAIFNITLPVGSQGDTIRILDVATSFATNNVSLVPNGTETIMGVNTPFALDVDDREYKVIYTGTDWRVI